MNISKDVCFICRVSLDYEHKLIYLNPTKFHTTELNSTIPYSASSAKDYLVYIFNYTGDSSDFDIETKSGFRIIIHQTDELPSDSSIQFRQQFQYSIARVFPHQTLIDELTNESFERRNCYFDHEKVLKMFKVYSKKNCEHECQSFAYADRCNCVPFYLLSEFGLINKVTVVSTVPRQKFQKHQRTRFACFKTSNAPIWYQQNWPKN
jgi:hypothetical protein